ncbi:hypothetical protein A2630_02610 [Candidatus Woesebacteria bacterium RIFCSPHIGHO2_01_FULL_44_10]|uniref:Resolvase HTH domain-containing protein n=1 Tax=Candidatus Woesebacteria bacterium RIFCSPLOWO2_01_FULL_44_14 TaxID=1802525 RepID=A0A1F8C5I9_9BACT|nr:MAG: hypothetical protein A2630_02610 [Candidatus Woesebacteria bacterium RIFCSPHIGHO2_01_FULL_44_10]OGM56132.1 MAG: hypothetical protein A3F62_00680 [Candidatus Woesebacteria bacterium RIFCSPHIGHO2_12_FULL_44_11]OGM70935.1 MAG: hypothetical protein A2975_01525 [Candidatus Woesebacteria bacterium RIFCSPLOWO2_01_FULL_44_14]
MAYSIQFKERAIRLRKKGYSIKEIAKKLNLAISTSSLWLRDVALNDSALERLKKRHLLGQYHTHLVQKKKREQKIVLFRKMAKDEIKKIPLTKELQKLICSILFWTEGAKTTTLVKFINSDPIMASLFMKLMRSAYSLDESKFRAKLHLHEYHNEEEMKLYWSKKLNLPLTQFTKTYKKPHSGKRKRSGYPGCVTISYYDYEVALNLYSLYNTYARKIIGA